MVALLVLGTATPAAAETFVVRAARQSDGTGWRWRPKHTFNVDVGDFIRWRNPTSRTHNVSAIDNGADWNYFRNLPPDTSVRRQFNRTGDFWFRCTLHSSCSGGTCSGQWGIIHVRNIPG
jgi:plastocyanin